MKRTVAVCDRAGAKPLARALAVSCLCLFAVSCAVDFAAEERAVRALWTEFERAFNEGDAGAVAQFYAEDSDRIGANGERVVGRARIRERYAAMMQRRASDPSSKPFRAAVEVRFVRPDVALLDGMWRGTRAGRAVRGFFTLTARKDDGRWQFVAGRDRGVVASDE